MAEGGLKDSGGASAGEGEGGAAGAGGSGARAPPVRGKEERAAEDAELRRGGSDLSDSELSPTGPRAHAMSAREMREWHFVQQYYEDRIRTLSQFPVALVATGLILIYFSGVLCSLAIAGLLWLIFSPLIESLSEPFYYPVHYLLRLTGLRMLRSGEVRHERSSARCPRPLLFAVDIVARIRVPRLLCVMLVLVFVGFCFWLLVAKTFASVVGVVRNSDNLLTLLSHKAEAVRVLLDQSVLADTVDWDAVIGQMVSHAREVTTEESIEESIWWIIRCLRVSLANFFLVFLLFMFLTLAGESRYPSTRKNRPKSAQVVVIEKYLYAQTFLSLLTAAVNGTIYGYLHVPASFLFALTTFWLNFIPGARAAPAPPAPASAASHATRRASRRARSPPPSPRAPPVVGSVIAVILPLPLALIVLDTQACTAAFALPCVVQLVIGNTLYPILMGRTMLLHPVTILVGMSMCAPRRGPALHPPPAAYWLPARLPSPPAHGCPPRHAARLPAHTLRRFGTLLSIPGMILSVPILGVLKSFLEATDHPYAQVCSYVLEGSIGKAIRSWETARLRLIASASALSPQPVPSAAAAAGHAHASADLSRRASRPTLFPSRRAAAGAPAGEAASGRALRRLLLPRVPLSRARRMSLLAAHARAPLNAVRPGGLLAPCAR